MTKITNPTNKTNHGIIFLYFTWLLNGRQCAFTFHVNPKQSALSMQNNTLNCLKGQYRS